MSEDDTIEEIDKRQRVVDAARLALATLTWRPLIDAMMEYDGVTCEETFTQSLDRLEMEVIE